ncbi:LamG domain-containing protein [Methylomagnum ishizawai]|uniref:LamG domain-containing protein n=1 Tax=Methylomagnum ishizawai TaxID=1760988 RepID=UPI001C32ABCA|nr:LamG domain-containing protein [Methylomagnum ishizawai]BBL74603.1 hypothetical protein MishRS11D_17010 [Methylomagnum ishizawai]
MALADLNTGLIAYYPFNGNANDESGNGNNGVEYGGLTYTSGKIGQAASFDGIDDFIEITPKGNVSAIGDFSISTWTYLIDFKTQTAPWITNEKDRQYVFDGHGNSKTATYEDFNRPGFTLIYDGDSTTQEIHDGIEYGSAFSSNYLEQNTPFAIKGKWLHHVFIRKGDKDYTYLDGKLIKSSYANNVKKDTLLDMQHDWFIGTSLGNNPNYGGHCNCHFGFNYSFYGLIDDMRIYGRALAASEIQTLYYQGNPPIIQGTAPWATPHTVTCQNVTQRKTVTIPSTKTSAWDCQKAGLPTKSGDKVKVTIEGTKY